MVIFNKHEKFLEIQYLYVKNANEGGQYLLRSLQIRLNIRDIICQA